MPNLLHLGSGGMILPGYINTDIDQLEGVDLVLDASVTPYPFEATSLDEIKNSHMIEHIEENKILPMLKEWYRILKDNGKVIIDVPDIETAIKKFYKGTCSWDTLLHNIYGSPNEREHQVHKWGYTSKTLAEYFKKVGFSQVKEEESPDYHQLGGIPTFRLVVQK